MIVVSGSPRTGTSMMMQTLVNLGYPTVAPRFTEEHSNVIKYNPKGFYELGLDELIKVDLTEYGKILKIFGTALPLFDTSLIYKMIVMKRKRKDAIDSSIPVYKGLGDDSTLAEKIYDVSYENIKQTSKKVSTIFINFEDMIQSPEVEIKRVVEFLGRDFDKEKISRAITNIDKS